MDNTILASLIGAGATIVAALLGLAAVLWSRTPPRTGLHAKDEKPTHDPPVRTALREPVHADFIAGSDQSRGVPHDGVTTFWLQYWQCVQSEFSVLSLRKPETVPAGSDWPQFRNAELGVGRRIVHKWSEGFVDLEIQGAGDAVGQIRARNQAVLE